MASARPCRHCERPIAPDVRRCPHCGGKKPRRSSWGNATIVAILLFVGFVWFGVHFSDPDSVSDVPQQLPTTTEPRPRLPGRGDVTTFAQMEDGRVFMFADEDTVREWQRLSRASDTEGMQLMWATPQVWTVDSGTECRVLDPAVMGVVDVWCEVRILGGPHWGKSGLVRLDDLERVLSGANRVPREDGRP